LNRKELDVPAEYLGTSKTAILVQMRFAEPDGPKFEGAIAKLQERPEPALRTGGCFVKIPTFVKGGNE
jgi:hypothetical protein